MNNILRDMDALCQATAKEREERYRASCRMARISETLLSGDEITCDGGTKIKVPIETGWKEQQLTDEEIARIGAHDDHVMFIIDEGDVPADSILFPDRENDGLHYGKTCEETFDEILRDMVDELQDMVKLFESMNMIRDCDIDDMLRLLEANIAAYNLERST